MTTEAYIKVCIPVTGLRVDVESQGKLTWACTWERIDRTGSDQVGMLEGVVWLVRRQNEAWSSQIWVKVAAASAFWHLPGV